MFSAFFYLIFGSISLFVGLTGKGLRHDLEAEKARKGRKILTVVGALLLVGAVWEFLDP